MTGMVHWGVLLWLFDGEQPVLGVMVQPYTGEVFSGDGERAWLTRGGATRALEVRPCARLEDVLACVSSPHFYTDPGELRDLGRFEREVRLTRYGGDCYIFAMLAAGQLDLVLETGLNPYDILPLILDHPRRRRGRDGLGRCDGSMGGGSSRQRARPGTASRWTSCEGAAEGASRARRGLADPRRRVTIRAVADHRIKNLRQTMTYALSEEDVGDDLIAVFEAWMDAAIAADIAEPPRASLATVDATASLRPHRCSAAA